jgi:hypothetical protein
MAGFPIWKFNHWNLQHLLFGGAQHIGKRRREIHSGLKLSSVADRNASSSKGRATTEL